MGVIKSIQCIWKTCPAKFKERSRTVNVKYEMRIIFFTISFFTISLYAQNSKVSWSLFNADFSFSKNINSGIMSESVQNFIGITKNSSTKITSGYFAGYSSIITNIDDNKESIPKKFELSQNYPNPFNPATTIKYSIPKTSFVTLKIYDILGREVATLVNEEKTAGNFEVSFNAANLSSGVYFYRIQAGSFVATKKLLLLK